MYKFIPIDEYKQYYAKEHPNARVNNEGTEAVISCNNHKPDCKCLSHQQAIDYIQTNWNIQEPE